jgi:HAD superfamily hydrolase (TIGR01509 family)
MGADKLLPKTTGVEHDSEEGKNLLARRSAIFHEKYLPRLEPFPGSRALVLRVRAEGLKPIVATSAKEDELKALLEAATVNDLMEERATSSDAKHSKPDPDIVEAAIEESGIDKADLIMIGDTPYDVEAATRAGVKCIAFRSGGWKDGNLKGAVAIFDGPADLLAHYDASPLGRKSQ